jgi:hypothetical protein
MAQLKFGVFGDWKRVKNLGWLLRNAAKLNNVLIVWVEKDPEKDGYAGDLSVYFYHRDRSGRGNFKTGFADFEVFKEWLKRRRNLPHKFQYLAKGARDTYEVKV